MSAPRQGPNAGSESPAEDSEYEDEVTGARVRRLTSASGSDNRHLYFTEQGWYDDGERLLVRGRRDGDHELFSVDLDSGRITQLTDLLDPVENVTRAWNEPVAYAWSGDHLVGVDLESLDVWSVYERVGEWAGYSGGKPAVTADGETVCFQVVERAVPRPGSSGNRATDAEGDDDENEDEGRGSWMHRMFEAGPHSAVLTVPASGGEATAVHETDAWLGHVNTSPTDPDLLTYCHEGPWERVDGRIRGLDLATGERWRVRPTDEGEAVGHEFWLADGERVGYHGWRGGKDDPEAFFGVVDADGSNRREAPAPDIYTHFHANDTDLVVCDGSHRGVPYLLVWADRDGEWVGPRKLASHDWAGDDDAHPHSRIGPDGETVAFDSTMAGGDSDVYLVDVPDFDELSPLD